MQKPKKIPQRQCLGCREMKNKKDLNRVVRPPEGEISLDFKGIKPARGSYVCPVCAYLAEARESRSHVLALTSEIRPDAYHQLAQEMGEANG